MILSIWNELASDSPAGIPPGCNASLRCRPVVALLTTG